MTQHATPHAGHGVIDHPTAWRGDRLVRTDDWIRVLTDDERTELVRLGRQLVDDDPDLHRITADDYLLDTARLMVESIADQLDRGLGFLLVRGLDPVELGDAVCGAIFFIVGLHLGVPMQQNQNGDLIDHVIATSSKTLDDPDALPSRVRDRLPFHSDSSDVVGLVCLRPAKSGGASSLVSGVTVYNEMVNRRPDLAARLFDEFHWDWRRQDPDAPAATYTSPVCSYVDGVFSTYAGSTMVFSAQEYPGVPPLTDDQRAALELYDELTHEPGLAIDMDFRPGDMQWLLNYAALHSRTAYDDWPEPERRRHLLRLWLRRDVGRPVTPGFGKSAVIKDRGSEPARPSTRSGHIAAAVTVNEDWGN